VDGRQSAAQSFWWSSGKTDGGKGANPTKEADLNPWPAPFDQPFYLIMNVAVGGKFAGKPDRTVFPAEMVVDYVRVSEKVGVRQGQAPRRGQAAVRQTVTSSLPTLLRATPGRSLQVLPQPKS
jgi:hypothetical protein